MSLYEDLGVAPDADANTIKKTYRKRAMQTHPDRGGSKDEFAKISRAYSILSDPAKREQYDRHGTTDTCEQNTDLIALANLLMSALNGSQAIDNQDIIQVMRDAIANTQSQLRSGINDQKRTIAKYRKAAKRLKFSGDGSNPLAAMIDGQIAQIEQAIRTNETNLETGDRLLKILKDYNYDVEKGLSPQLSQFVTITIPGMR